MKIAYALPTPPLQAASQVLTIGNFDGVHIGHQSILKKTIQLAAESRRESAVLSFSNHPSTILRPSQAVRSLCTLAHKLHLLEAAGIDQLYLIPFTKEFSTLSAEEFLKNLHAKNPFSHLVLGYDAVIGKDKQGDRATVESLADQIGFKVVYLPEYKIEGQTVSSSLIRRTIQNGDLKSAAKLLGRPYSIYAQVQKGAGRGKDLGIHTANIPVEGLCILPLGVYAVQLVHSEFSYPAVANLGIAPTFRTHSSPLLEVHIWDHSLELYGQYVEVIFHEYIRPEKKFETAQMLKEQIHEDIFAAQRILDHFLS